MGLRRSDDPDRRKRALMRKALTESESTHNLGGVKKPEPTRKPSLPKMPWDDEPEGSE